MSRIREVIRRRGENLSPLEVGDVLTEHPAVLECAVVGVLSDLTEEEVKAFIVAAQGQQPDFAEHRLPAGHPPGEFDAAAPASDPEAPEPLTA
ncbi:MAG TPA: hypothetical protein VMV07_05955 [Streptosporangiaceae bacterium]|nr:hypothetical protein [Streptosporangiaceae bacterium]